MIVWYGISMNFFVYVHKRKDNGRIFYVGKGCRYRHKSKWARTPHWHNIVNKYGYTAEIVKNNLTQDAAFAFEMKLIKKYKHLGLCNLTDGGDGARGIIVSDKTRAKLRHRFTDPKYKDFMRKKLQKRFSDPEYRAAHVARIKAQVSRPEVKLKISKSLKKYFSDPENRKKRRLTSIAHFKNPEARALASKKARERFNTPEKRSEHAQAKSVKCIETGMIFGTGTLAAEWIASQGKYKGDHSSIAKVCRGEKISAFGYTWKYVKQSKD